MVNQGLIIQIKDKFRMPYSTNMNTISAFSNVAKNTDSMKRNPESANNSKEDSKSVSGSSNISKAKGDLYISCRAKYNNKNKSLLICKKASSGNKKINVK